MRAVSVRGAALAAVVTVALLAGCAAPATSPDAAPEGLAPGELEAGAFYTFHHDGGSLSFSLDGVGDAAFDLYDGADQRLGSVGFSSGAIGSGQHRIDGVAAGEVVLGLETLNGTLRVRSGDRTVDAFHPLLSTVERHVLADREPRLDPLASLGVGGLPALEAEPADLTTVLSLQRTPSSMRVLATGPASNLTIEVRSERGVVLRTTDSAFLSAPNGITFGPMRALAVLPSDLVLQNLRDGELTAHVRAEDLAGVVLLESTTYSRARLPDPPAPGPAAAEVPFTYGELPDAPVAFEVHRAADALYVWRAGNATAPADGKAYLAVFDADDRRVATVDVPRKGTARIDVAAGGQYVAVALAGDLVLGADRAPADFELRPLEEREQLAPTTRAGANSRYGQASAEVDLPNAFALRVAALPPPDGAAPTPVGNCDPELQLRVDQGGESLLAALTPTDRDAVDAGPFIQGSAALGVGPLTILHDGFGDDGCDRLAVTIVGYVR